MDVPFDGVKWDEPDGSQIQSPWSFSGTSSSSWHTGDSKFSILTGIAREMNLELPCPHIIFDKLAPPGDRALRCVVIGSQKPEVAPNIAARKYYVLVITKRSDVSDDMPYERVGVGTLLGSWIALEGPGSKVLIH